MTAPTLARISTVWVLGKADYDIIHRVSIPFGFPQMLQIHLVHNMWIYIFSEPTLSPRR